MRISRSLLVVCLLALASPPAWADEVSDLKAKFEALQHQMEAVKAQLDQVTAQMQKDKQKAAEAPAHTAAFVQRKEGAGLTFLTPGGEVQLYGNLDVSLDTTTKGLESSYEMGGSPVGKMGWMPAISSNLSYVGVRGKQELGGSGTDFVYQLETQIDIAATAGTANTNSNSDTTVKGALTSRNSFIGFAGHDWGGVKIGKSDAPYKNSTARMNPFSGMLGDYAVIMGNTGGDNRVEFGTRLDHSLWYESPNMSGFTFNALYAPGQNRSDDNSLIASGESSCAGGNIPGSGALPPACNDGSYGTAYSGNVAYQHGPLYLTAAYEMHKDVNRTSDLPNLDPRDVGDEHAAKFGIQYTFPTHTTVGAIYEDMKRDIPDDLQYQNERTRKGYWLTLTQGVTERDNVSFGWAHADATPGDPGQHNTTGGPNPDNAANMYTIAWKHALDKSTTIYADWAMTVNHPDAHYDLGAGGRSVTTDCHDASILAAFDPTTGAVTGDGPHCFAGGRLQGFSVGANFKF
jgi:predicted porin